MFALLLLHLVLGLALLVAGRRLGRRAFALAAVAPAATLVWVAARASDVVDGTPVVEDATWVGGLGLGLDLRLDAFGLLMVLLVSGIGLLVCVYSLGYFSHPAPGTARLAGLVTLFAGSMLGVVLADHLLALFVFWELTSVTSYLLIGNDDRNPNARAAALQAILITGSGGLAMMLGLVVIGQAAGTYRLSELIADPPSGGVVGAGLVLVLLGAFTKSAQAPFGSWLPGAMVAPTPISAYLHSATMVKAGVYLVARLSPLVATLGIWRPLVLVVGSVTMVVGGWRALRQHDLKLLLAHGTVSQLGFLMLLFGTGEYGIAQAGIVLLLAHGAFKATLFMVVGIVDHQAGTRDVRLLTGFDRSWRPVLVIAVIGAASMAGIPPLLGFVAKEKALAALDTYGTFPGAATVLVVVVVGSVLTFAYSARFVLGLFGRLAVTTDGAAVPSPSRAAPAPSRWFLAPPMVLTVVTVVAGVAPMLIDELVAAATVALDAAATPTEVVLWAGFELAVVLSAIVIGLGTVLVLLHRRVELVQGSVHRVTSLVPSAQRTYEAAVDGVTGAARRVTAVVQHGSLPLYLAVIVGTAAVVPLVPMLRELDEAPTFSRAWVHVPIAVLVVVCAVAAAASRRRLSAVLLLGAVGYLMAGFYVAEGAPDLALTQFAVETLATVLFVLVLRFLPRTWSDRRRAVTAPVRFAVAAAVGAAVFVFALAASAARSDVSEPPVSDEMIARSAPEAKGNNVVNVILVDFRGLDTLGEITVLLVAAVGAVMLARTGRRPAASTPSDAAAAVAADEGAVP